MIFTGGEDGLSEKIAYYELQDLRKYCEENGIKGDAAKAFIKRSMSSIAKTREGGSDG